MQFNVKSKDITKRIFKMLAIFYKIHREDFQFSGYGVVKI